jgi:uncharacterized surface protein with fasciclin (FAS1) repeats
MMDSDTTLSTGLRNWAGLGLGLLAVVLVMAGCDSQDLGDADPETPSVTDYISEIPALSSLNDAVQTAGLASTLDSGGPFTVFAPTNDAFAPPIDASLNVPVAEKVLRHHVVSGEVTADQLSDGQTVAPLAGDDLTIGVGEAITVNRATVTNANADAANGVVHVVDKLLADAVDRATLTPRFTIFARLVKEADLESALRAPGANNGRTIFAPTNEALLDLLDANGNGEVESSEIPTNAAEVLQHHVLDSVFLAADVPESETAVPTLEGTDVTVVRSGDAVTVNSGDESASVTTANVEVDNGVIHGIDTVLVP